MAEEEDQDGLPDQEELDALEEAVSDDEETPSAAGEGEDGLDPLADEMLKMMEEEGDEGQASQADVDRMMEVEMLKAMEAEGGGLGGGAAVGGAALTRGAGGGLPPSVSRLMDVSLSVTIELGRTEATLEEVMSFGEQSLVELDKQVGDPVDILVNGKLFAKGEVVTVSEYFGVRITELLTAVTDL